MFKKGDRVIALKSTKFNVGNIKKGQIYIVLADQNHEDHAIYVNAYSEKIQVHNTHAPYNFKSAEPELFHQQLEDLVK